MTFHDSEYRLGQSILYRSSNGRSIPGKIVSIDKSFRPYSFGVKLQGHNTIRETMGSRLSPRSSFKSNNITSDDQYYVSQPVVYQSSTGGYLPGKIVSINRSSRPYSYGVKLKGHSAIRETVGSRILPVPGTLHLNRYGTHHPF